MKNTYYTVAYLENSDIIKTELCLTNLQMDCLKLEVEEYGIGNTIFLYEVALDVYKKDSTMYNFTSAKIEFLKTLKKVMNNFDNPKKSPKLAYN